MPPSTVHRPPSTDNNSWQLEYLLPSVFEEWDTFVDTSPQSTIYGKSWYLAALQSTFRILVVKEKEIIIGGIVLTLDKRGNYINPWLCKYLGIYYGTFLGNAYNQETKRRKIAKLILKEITRLSSFNYAFHPSFTTYLPFHIKEYSNSVRYSYWINLKDQSLEAIQSKFHTKVRSEIKFAQKQSYSIERNIDFEPFFTICQLTFLQKKQPFPFSKSFLKQYYQQLKEKEAFQTLAVKDANGILLAVAGLLKDEKTTSLILSGFDRRVMKRGANELLLWECIQLAKTQSDFFDFEGSMIPSIESFYRKFGGDYTPYLTIYKETFWQFVYKKLLNYLANKKKTMFPMR